VYSLKLVFEKFETLKDIDSAIDSVPVMESMRSVMLPMLQEPNVALLVLDMVDVSMVPTIAVVVIEVELARPTLVMVTAVVKPVRRILVVVVPALKLVR
jgi:hypothetical protein